MEVPEELQCFVKYIPMSSHKEVADAVLMEFVEIVKKLNLTFHLEYGVCLGFVRDGGYIEYDNDIDIVVHANDAEWMKLINTLGKHGFSGDSHIVKNKIMLDVGRTEKAQQFDSVTYEGVKFNVPHPVEEYLEQTYGEDWKTRKLYGQYWEWHKFINRKVGYSFVVADLLHVGHIHHLKKCKEHCDFLIVGVLTDEAVEAYKRKPIIPDEQRVISVESLKMVDKVVLQDDRDPTETMKRLVEEGWNIKVLFHADNWKNVPGTKYIKGRGGKLIQPPYLEGISTTQIIKKIRKLKNV